MVRSVLKLSSGTRYLPVRIGVKSLINSVCRFILVFLEERKRGSNTLVTEALAKDILHLDHNSYTSTTSGLIIKKLSPGSVEGKRRTSCDVTLTMVSI